MGCVLMLVTPRCWYTTAVASLGGACRNCVFLCHALANNVDQGHVFHGVAFDQRNPLRKWIVGGSPSSGHCKRYRASLHDSVEPVVASESRR